MLIAVPDLTDLLFVTVLFFVCLLVTVVGLAIAVLGWCGSRGGIILGALLGLAGVASLGCTWLSYPRLWWINVPPIYAAWLAVAAWRSRADSGAGPRFRFGMRGMLGFVLAITLLLGGAAEYYGRQRAEQRIVAQLNSRQTDVEWSFGRASRVLMTPGTDQDFMQTVERLKELSDLRTLQVNNGSRLSASVTAQLAELTSLRQLFLQHVPVSDSDLEPLGRLWRLELLELEGSGLTDEGLARFYPLKNLKRLYLYNADPRKVTPQGMQRLRAEIPTLED